MDYTKIHVSGDYIEIYEYEKSPSKKIKYQKRRKKSNERDRAAHILLARRSDNLARARSAFIRLVRSNLVGDVPPSLVTLTMYEVCGIDQACDIFTKFIVRLRRNEGKAFRYIAVPEFQRRGAVHFHLIVWGLKNEIIEQERYNRYLQNIWQYGYVDCLSTDGNIKLAGYLAKYMSKTMQDIRLCAKRAYLSSHNILRSVSLKGSFAYGHLAEAVELSTAEVLHDKESMTKWLGKGRYRLLKLSIK